MVGGNGKATVDQTLRSSSGQHQSFRSSGLVVLDVHLRMISNRLTSTINLPLFCWNQYLVNNTKFYGWINLMRHLFMFLQDLSYSTDFPFVSGCCNDVWDWDLCNFPSGACAIPHTWSHLHAPVLACSSIRAQVHPVSTAADLLCTLCAYGKTAEGGCQTKCRTPIASHCCTRFLFQRQYIR